MSMTYHFGIPHDLLVDPFDSFSTLIPSYRSYNRVHYPRSPVLRSLLARDHYDRRLLSKAFDELATVFNDHVSHAASVLPSSIRETAKAYELDIDLPGVNKEAIDISINDRVLTITSERKAVTGITDKADQEKAVGEAARPDADAGSAPTDVEKKSEGVVKKQQPVYHHQEIRYGKTTRSYSLPEDADESAVTAKYERGVLHVEIMKKVKQEEKVKRIKIE
jgi:HSP20 family protein